MKTTMRKVRTLLGGALMLAALTMTGCARFGEVPAYEATATAAFNPQLPPEQARSEANARAETQARDQILIEAGEYRLPDGRTLEDVAAADPYVRALLLDTVRSAHQAGRTVSPEGSITLTLRLPKDAVERIAALHQAAPGR